ALAMRRIDACTLAGGDDYELCFTAPSAAQAQVLPAAQQAQTPVTCIGRIEAQPGVLIMTPGGQQLPLRFSSFDHFA
ncbi:MAG: thiamine-phosphate kinase, partial [Comamonas sp.]|nr:thiamine-phosphate kinase [Candidatus Comamonas equi]